jgi:hypothetical protein
LSARKGDERSYYSDCGRIEERSVSDDTRRGSSARRQKNAEIRDGSSQSSNETVGVRREARVTERGRSSTKEE